VLLLLGIGTGAVGIPLLGAGFNTSPPALGTTSLPVGNLPGSAGLGVLNGFDFGFAFGGFGHVIDLHPERHHLQEF